MRLFSSRLASSVVDRAMPIVDVPRVTVSSEGLTVRRPRAFPAAGRGRVAWAAMAICALALLAAASLPAQAQSVSFAGVQTTVPASGLRYPNGVAVDGAGDVFIADSGNNRVVKVPAGCTNAACQTTVGSGLDDPAGVAVDGAGDVFIANFNDTRVVEVPAGCTSAACQTTVGSGLIPRTAWRWMSGRCLHRRCYGNDRVVKVPAGCASAACQTTVGSGLEQSRPPWRWMERRCLHRGFRQQPGGRGSGRLHQRRLPDDGGQRTEFPAGVAVDGAGDVFIADTGNSRVVEVPSGCTNAACQTTVGADSVHPMAWRWMGRAMSSSADTDNSRVVEVKTRSVDFGSVNVGASTSLTLNYNIDSSVAVSAVNVVTQGAPNLDFTLSSTTCTGSQAAGSSCTVTVSFAPRAPGVRMGAVELTGSSGQRVGHNLPSRHWPRPGDCL
jgi:hypothetical protein